MGLRQLAPPTESARLAPRRVAAARAPSLSATVLSLQRAAGNRASRQLVARFKKGLTTATVEQVRALPMKKQIDFLIAVSKREQEPESDVEVRDLHRALVLNGLGRAAHRVKPYAADSAFARDITVLETLGAKLETTTLDDADVTSLIRALRTVEREPETPPVETPAPTPLASAVPAAVPVPVKAPEKPAGPKRLDGSMAPSNVETAIRDSSEGGKDETGQPVLRAWDTWSMYVSSWDKPKSAGGKSDAWGFSSSHVLAGLQPQKTNLKGSAPAEAGKQKWIVHVHRTAKGDIKAATVQWADLEGAGGEKGTLTAKQLTRIGVPANVDPYGTTASGENKVPGVWKYNWK